MELIISVAMLAIISAIGAGTMMMMSRESRSAEVRGQVNSAWFELKRMLLQSLTRVDGPMFAPATTYTQLADGSFQRLGADAAGPRSLIWRAERASLRTEGGSFLRSFAEGAFRGESLDVHQNSFTLRKIAIRSHLGGTPGAETRWVQASRCVPFEKRRLEAKTGFTVDSKAPLTSAVYVLAALDRVPFIHPSTDPKDKNPVLSCCPVGTPCRERNAQNYLVRSYWITFGADGRPNGISELPLAFADAVWGGGFMISVGGPRHAALYTLHMFSQVDVCKSGAGGVGPCMNTRPLSVVENKGAFANYFKTKIRTKHTQMTGMVSQDLASSGVISFAH